MIVVGKREAEDIDITTMTGKAARQTKDDILDARLRFSIAYEIQRMKQPTIVVARVDRGLTTNKALTKTT
jgi:hypothetical protein